jgi:hypothetical protein
MRESGSWIAEDLCSNPSDETHGLRGCSKVQGPAIYTMMNPNEWQIAEAFFPAGMGKSTFLTDEQDVLWSIPVFPNVKKEAWSKDGSTRISNPTVTHCYFLLDSSDRIV